MRVLIALLLMLFVAVSAYNWLQVQELRAEVAALSKAVAQTRKAPADGPGDASVTSLADDLAAVRESIARGDWKTARRDMDAARERIDAAAARAGRTARPVVEWVSRQARELEAQIEKQKQTGR